MKVHVRVTFVEDCNFYRRSLRVVIGKTEHDIQVPSLYGVHIWFVVIPEVLSVVMQL